MRRLLDTSAIYSWIDWRADTHRQARAQLRESGLRLVTTNVVAGETFTLIRNRLGYPVALRALSALFESDVFSVEFTDRVLDQHTRDVIRRMSGVPLSYADASLIALGEREGLSSVFSFDSDFRMAGLTLVP